MKKALIVRIEKAFLPMLKPKRLGKISVLALCQRAGRNRFTFYANDTDRNGLAATMIWHYSAIVRRTSYFKLGYGRGYHIATHDGNLAKRYFQNRLVQ